ncbi:MAG: hypothetical protein FWH11_13600, partial [Micrococcales bacterium]|nr:hypothetical protein [Micrococcales bacterium]
MGLPWPHRLGLPGRHLPPSLRAEWTCPNDGAVSVANTSGAQATDAGTVLPPTAPVRMTSKVSRAYSREQAGHTSARRFPQGTCSTPSGWSSEENLPRDSPVVVSQVSDDPCRRTGAEQCPTR